MQNLLSDLTKLLEKEEKFTAEGKILKNKVVEAALKLDPNLLKILLKNKTIKKHFFQEVEGTLVFDKSAFQKFISSKSFLPDSYTAFKNKIGLTVNGEYLTENKEIVLSFPYKDCVLEGGQTKEDAKRNEVFWNETLAPDEIDRLLSPKVFTNFKKYDKKGEHKVSEISLNDNLIIKGNNLLALHSLLPVYRGKIKLIYIDPPYNTGNDSFLYNDNFNHSTWLLFMKNRLEVARELLSNQGSIFISIDQKEIGALIILLDEIFGGINKKNIITVKRSSVSGAKVINPGVVNVTEYILLYCKNPDTWKPNKVLREKERDNRYNTYIKNIDDEPYKWKYCTVLEAFANEYKMSKNDLRKHFGLDYEIELEKFYYKNSKNIIRFAALDDNSISEEVKKLKYISQNDNSKTYVLNREEKANYYLYKGNAILFFKDRLTEINGKEVYGELISDLWDDVLPNDIHNEGGVKLRKGKKPEKLISRLIEIGSNEGDIILDFFIGSGTTAAVANKRNRKFIGIEQMDYINELPIKRMQNTIKGERSGVSKEFNWQGGGSFVYCELSKLNQNFIDKINSAKTIKELKKIWEEMQKSGFLSYKINPKTINEKIGRAHV